MELDHIRPSFCTWFFQDSEHWNDSVVGVQGCYTSWKNAIPRLRRCVITSPMKPFLITCVRWNFDLAKFSKWNFIEWKWWNAIGNQTHDYIPQMPTYVQSYFKHSIIVPNLGALWHKSKT